MKLVITEKPSVAFAVAKALNVSGRKNGYIEGGDYIITWCIGHLVNLADPSAYNSDFAKWNYEDLPIIPDNFIYKVYPDKQKQFKTVKELMHRKDVSEVINACDAGREGELIFRLVYNQAKCKKKYMRLWISSMEESAIKSGFDNLHDGGEYENLYKSALCRLWADWLVGINATRLFSLLYRKTLNIGRVQTPTLALIVDRDNTINFFKPEKYYATGIEAEGVKATGIHLDSDEKKTEFLTACEHSQAVCTSIKKEQKTEKPPKLFDLTTLQREANKIYGYTAKQTLDYAQSLYEKKLLTYPRTDSRYLTEDMADTVKSIIDTAATLSPFDALKEFKTDIVPLLNNSKVSDHHAIIPTLELIKTDISQIPQGEQSILRLVIYKLLCAVSEPFIYEITTAKIECGGYEFSVKGKIVIKEGFKEIEKLFNSTQSNEDDGEFPELYEGQTFENVKVHTEERQTTPPSQYTEDTLLSAMEHTGAKETNADAERKGLGTPATRAAIIEKIINTGFAERKGKQIIPTQKGGLLISVLPDALISAARTAEWENKLTQIAKGQENAQDFMQGISAELKRLVNTYPCNSKNEKSIFD